MKNFIIIAQIQVDETKPNAIAITLDDAITAVEQQLNSPDNDFYGISSKIEGKEFSDEGFKRATEALNSLLSLTNFWPRLPL